MKTSVNAPRPEDAAALEYLRTLCRANDQLEIAVLIGSRATGRSHEDSDWDIAIQWHRQSVAAQQFGLAEQLRHQ
ncbi:MAG: nucleotidyltransferase domain-containing protein, partial [Oxalobacteraceae bacterium]